MQCSFASHLQYEVHDMPADQQLEHGGTELHSLSLFLDQFGQQTSIWYGLTAQSHFKISPPANLHQQISVIHFFCVVSLPAYI